MQLEYAHSSVFGEPTDAHSVRGRTLAPCELSNADLAIWRGIQSANPLLDSAFFAPEFTLALGAARDDTRVTVLTRDREVVGFFPHHRLRGRIGKPIGGPMSDYHGVIADKEIDLAPAQLLAASGLDAYDFNHAPVEFSYLAFGTDKQSSSPRIERRPDSDTFSDAANKSVRLVFKDVDRCLRNLDRDHGKWEFNLREGSEEAWEWLIEMKTRQLAQRGKKAGFREPWVARTHDALRSKSTDSFETVLSTLRVGGRIIAAHLGLRWRHVMSWWQTTYDDEFRKYGPGIALIVLTLRQAAAEDVRVIDFGRGTEAYKRVLANCERSLVEGSIVRPRSRADALRKGHRIAISWADRLPLGRYQDVPRRAITRLISGVRLPPAGKRVQGS